MSEIGCSSCSHTAASINPINHATLTISGIYAITGRRSSAARVPCYRRRPSDVRRQRVASVTKASVRQRINSVLDRARRHGYCPRTCRHLMNCVTPPTKNYSVKLSNYHITSYTHYSHHHPPHHRTIISRHRTHSLELPAHTTHLTDCAFITRMLYKDVY